MSSNALNLFIYGTGGHGKEIAIVAKALEKNGLLKLTGYIDDNPEITSDINELPILKIENALSNLETNKIIIGIGNSKIREEVAKKIKGYGLGFLTLIHPNVEISKFIELGEGCTIFNGCVLTTNIKLGQHVHINSCSSISHDSIIEDYSTICPGAKICGNVHIGKRVFIGAGSTVIHGTPASPLKIADDTYIAAGACVTKSINRPGVYAGVPAVFKKDIKN